MLVLTIILLLPGTFDVDLQMNEDYYHLRGAETDYIRVQLKMSIWRTCIDYHIDNRALSQYIFVQWSHFKKERKLKI